MTIHSFSRPLQIEVPLTFPAARCCNCGTPAGLSPVVTELKLARFMIFAGTEITLRPTLPYCSACAASARRAPTGLGGKLLASVVAALAVFVVASFIPAVAGALPPDFQLPLYAGVGAGLVFGFHALRRPTGRQTSFEQPVRLRRVKQRFTGEVTGYVLAFTQPDYAREFAAANQPAVDAGSVEVKAA